MANAAMQQQLGEQLLKATQVVEEQVDQEIERLERLNDDELETLRQRRIDQMKKAQKQREEWKANGHGEYTEVANEREFFDACKASKRVVCHFYRDSAFRCKVLDKHYRILAPRHLETRFITANVDRVPFLVERLNIRVIPTTACIKDGTTETWIRGYEGFAERDDFETEALERRLGEIGIINYSETSVKAQPKSVFGKPKARRNIRGDDDSDSDDGW